MNLVPDGVESIGVMMKEQRSCPRCHGFMVPVSGGGNERVLRERREWPGWRCVTCREQIDPMILANRLASRQDVHMRQRPCLP